jgi:hypothetical protein
LERVAYGPIDSALLTATREAIDALTAGGLSSYTVKGQTFTHQDLDLSNPAS